MDLSYRHRAARPSAADRVYLHVRMGILTRRFADHELLAEGRIAAETGVSRTPVREALLRLEAEGMVALLPKRGALVLPVTAREAREILRTRALIEGDSVREVLARPGGAAALVPTLDAALLELTRAAMVHDPHAYVTADRRFHLAVVEAADNSILTRLYSSLRDRQLRMGGENLLADNGQLDQSRVQHTLEDHRRIRDAIADDDLSESLRLIDQHLAHAAVSLT